MIMKVMYLMIVGGGEWSVDHWLSRRSLQAEGEHHVRRS
jgi:hypothetical protein